MTLRHQPERLGEILVGLDDDRGCRCDLAYLNGARVQPLGNRADDDVSIGQHADEASVVDDRHGAEVAALHQSRRLA
jgi:hypothetical protein